MNSFQLHEWVDLTRWLKEIGIKTLGQLKSFIDNVTDGTKMDIMDKAHACYIYRITF